MKEYAAGTNPADAARAFVVSESRSSGNDMRVSFPSVAGKSCRVESVASLGSPTAWQTVQDNVAGTGSVVTVTDAGGFARLLRFYRVILK